MISDKVAKAATRSQVEALADRLEPRLAKAVRELLRDHVARIDLDDLARAVEQADTARVLTIVGGVDPLKAAAVRRELEETIWAGGALAAQAPVFTEARFAFNRLNPALTTWIETYSLNLIREIDRATTESVRAALTSGLQRGTSPIDQARQVKQVVGLTERQAQSVQNYRRALETIHERRSVSRWGLGNERSRLSGIEVMPADAKGKPTDGIQQWRLRDQRYDATLQRAVESRKPLRPEQIEKMVARYQERYLQHRARSIARTETIRALNVGVYETWRQAIAQGKVDGSLVRKTWRVAYDERTCPSCTSVPKLNPKRGIPLEARFVVADSDPIYMPPLHPNCRCGIQVRVWERAQLFANF